jgi:hypothetical protein
VRISDLDTMQRACAQAIRDGCRPWSSTSKHHAFYFRDASIVIHQDPCRNLYSDGLTILVTANGHSHLRQRARSCVYIPREAPSMASTRLRRDDQFERISNCLKFSKSEQALGGRVPMPDRSISVDPDDRCHSVSSVEEAEGGPSRALRHVHHPIEMSTSDGGTLFAFAL